MTRTSYAALLAALLAALALGLAACGSSGSLSNPTASAPTPSPVSTSPSAPSTRPPTSDTKAAPTPALVLLPRSCTRADLRLQVIDAAFTRADGTQATLGLKNISSSRCWIGGIPRTHLLDGQGRVLPTRTRGYGAHRGIDHVVVRPGGSAYLALHVSPCATYNGAHSGGLRVLFAFQGFALTAPTPPRSGVAECRSHGDRVASSAVSAQRMAPGGQAHEPPENVAAPYADGASGQIFINDFTDTWGRADLNGDGHPDLVVVHPRGLVVASISGIGRREVDLAGGAGRLRGLPDLGIPDAPLRHEILAAPTAANGYEGAYGAPIIRFWHGRLGVVRLPHGEQLDLGVEFGAGDDFDGFGCAGGITRSAYFLDDSTLAVRRVTIHGLSAHLSPAIRSHLGETAGIAATAVDCPGLTSTGAPG